MKKEMNNLKNRRDFLRRSAAAVGGLAFLMVAGKSKADSSLSLPAYDESGRRLCSSCAVECSGYCSGKCLGVCNDDCTHSCMATAKNSHR